jgi:lipoprotein-anchoring transpeptidase ErfK/SrfK
MSLTLVGPLSGQMAQHPPENACRWWQIRCDDGQSLEALPPEAPRTGTVITIDVALNRLYLFEDGQLVDESPVATGSEKVLKHGSRIWLFRTPEGHLKVLRKIEDPVWSKPDWAFIEAGESVPPLNSPMRKVRGHLGKYALDLGDSIMIHGTDESNSIGRKVSHGCIRLPNDMLKTVYRSAAVGTDVYIFESQVSQTRPERHSDLDFR